MDSLETMPFKTLIYYFICLLFYLEARVVGRKVGLGTARDTLAHYIRVVGISLVFNPWNGGVISVIDSRKEVILGF